MGIEIKTNTYLQRIDQRLFPSRDILKNEENDAPKTKKNATPKPSIAADLPVFIVQLGDERVGDVAADVSARHQVDDVGVSGVVGGLVVGVAAAAAGRSLHRRPSNRRWRRLTGVLNVDVSTERNTKKRKENTKTKEKNN